MPPKESLALVNACLNGLCTLLLISGYVMIRRGNMKAHATMMISSLITSAAFLACYLTSHAVYGSRSLGLPRSPLVVAYFIILIPHILLAVGMLPMIFVTLRRALRHDFANHKRIARPTLLVWIYVSITGVVVYVLLYHVLPTHA